MSTTSTKAGWWPHPSPAVDQQRSLLPGLMGFVHFSNTQTRAYTNTHIHTHTSTHKNTCLSCSHFSWSHDQRSFTGYLPEDLGSRAHTDTRMDVFTQRKKIGPHLLNSSRGRAEEGALEILHVRNWK